MPSRAQWSRRGSCRPRTGWPGGAVSASPLNGWVCAARQPLSCPAESHGSGRHGRLRGVQLAGSRQTRFRSAGSGRLTRAWPPPHLRGRGRLPRSPIANVDRDAAERRHLDAAKLAGVTSVSPARRGMFGSSRGRASRDSAARGGGSASALSPASCETEPPIDPPPSQRHIYWRCGASRHAARGRAIATYQLDDHPQHHGRSAVESAWGAVSALPPARFPGRSPTLLGQCPVVAQGAGDAEQSPGHYALFRLRWA
jgi:hypothetical protein